MSDRSPEIPNTPEEMFPKEFDVYSTQDAAVDFLRAGDLMGSAELVAGTPERLGTTSIHKKNKAEKLMSTIALKCTQLRISISRR